MKNINSAITIILLLVLGLLYFFHENLNKALLQIIIMPRSVTTQAEPSNAAVNEALKDAGLLDDYQEAMEQYSQATRSDV